MFCISCRRAISENALFCPGCGKQLQRDRPLTITCQSCQASNPDDAIFCWNCGQRLQREESAVDFILPAPPFSGGVQPPAGNVPTVQGIPQAGGAPMVHGTPSAFDAPSVAPSTGHSLSQTPASSAGQPLSQGAASSANVSPSQSPPAPRPPVRTSHGTQSPRAPQPSVNTPQTSPASASRTKNASGGTRASRRILRPRVVLALVCVAVVVVAAATIGSLAVGAFNQPQKPPISFGPAANPTLAPTSTLTQPPAPVSVTDVPTPQPTLELTQQPTPTPTDTPAPTPTDTPTPTPTQAPTPTDTPPPVVFSSGTWQDPYGGASYIGDAVNMQLTVQGNTLSGTLTGGQTGDSTPVHGQDGPLNLFSSDDQGGLNYVIQHYGEQTGIFLVFTNDSQFEGAYPNSKYYGVVEQNGDIVGFWFFPNTPVDAGSIHMNKVS